MMMVEIIEIKEITEIVEKLESGNGEVLVRMRAMVRGDWRRLWYVDPWVLVTFISCFAASWGAQMMMRGYVM